ncbi:MAG: hypothetical protein IK058_00305 [Bacteroidales bacterium]|nr:hypothetical protein [Bacteroidales bacterium]
MLAVVAMAGCTPDDVQRQYTFNATAEQLDGSTKVRLYNEEWTYWEYGDNINIISNATTEMADGWLTGTTTDFEDYNGVFGTTLTEVEGKTSKWFVALHPANTQHVLSYPVDNDAATNKSFTAKIYLEGTQHYRHDSSYAQQVLPMVAWYGGREWGNGEDNPPRLDFHSLAGLVRLQLLNGTSTTKRITSIVLESIAGEGPYTRKRLHGLFPIEDLYTFNSYLTDSTVSNSSDATLTLSMEYADGGSLQFAPNDLKSFYIVLPAFHGMEASSYYYLKMTVNTTDGDSFEKRFHVRTRRNGITYLRAINITDFNSSDLNTATLVGNGTVTRPFKIYTLADLEYVRSCFNTTGTVYVNGQEVTANTYFRIMRSDINLNATRWTSGIKNFKGHMTYFANISNYDGTTALTGITNNSTHPLFESIDADGVVDGIAIRCDSIVTPPSGTDHSPLCGTNNGTIINCHTGVQASDRSAFYGGGRSFAGICAINKGTIEGCGCSYKGSTSTSALFAGICYNNQSTGTIRGCYAASPMQLTGPAGAAGICYTNGGTVEDCYFAARIESGKRWAGIVYQNTNKVTHCYFGDGSMIFADSVGGIVYLNSGLVDYCWADGMMSGDKVGGIATNVQSGGSLTNCFIDDSIFFLTLRSTGTRHLGGGLAAEVMSGGSIQNSYVVMENVVHPAGSTFGSVVGLVRSGGTVNNCYGLMDSTVTTPRFYGDTVSGTRVFTHCHLVSGTQAGINRIYAKDTISGTQNHLGGLLRSLNKYRGSYMEWFRDGNTNICVPHLADYIRPTTATKYRRRR